MTPYVAVVGPDSDDTDPGQLAVAEAVGAGLGRAGAVVVCGGLGGVMAAACRGARSTGATTVGLLPGARRGDANPWVDVAVATGLGEARNVLVVRAADAVVAVGGEYGTLSEIAFALKTGTPVVGVGTWDLPGIEAVGDAAAAVAAALRACGAG
ncbi:MAG TPA: TIGR00725 family protein [Acidimicrobiales bacterium]|nr:TIGR00725 family protein [Acidimicrobiales bacterium]